MALDASWRSVALFSVAWNQSSAGRVWREFGLFGLFVRKRERSHQPRCFTRLEINPVQRDVAEDPSTKETANAGCSAPSKNQIPYPCCCNINSADWLEGAARNPFKSNRRLDQKSDDKSTQALI